MHKKLWNLETSEDIYKEVISKKKKISRPLSRAISMDNLANLYVEKKEYDDAEELYLQSISLIISSYGEGHPELASMYNNLADLYRALGQLDAAERYLTQAIAIEEEHSGVNSSALVVLLLNLNAVYGQTGRQQDADKTRMRINQIMSGQPQ